MSVFTVYKTTHLGTGKYYYGFHETDDPHDKYLGSGIWVKRAVKKYGKKAFCKDVLSIYSTDAEAYNKEIELIKLAGADPLCMNLQEGGRGSFRYINQNGLSDYVSAARAGGKKASESGQAAQAAALGRKRMKESGLLSKLGRMQGTKNVENGFLATLRTPEHQKVGGHKSFEKKAGIFGLTLEQRLAASHAGGLAGGNKNAESGQMAALGRSGLGYHTRWHLNRGIVNSECSLCQNPISAP
jgi:hypothetical protein